MQQKQLLGTTAFIFDIKANIFALLLVVYIILGIYCVRCLEDAVDYHILITIKDLF